MCKMTLSAPDSKTHLGLVHCRLGEPALALGPAAQQTKLLRMLCRLWLRCPYQGSLLDKCRSRQHSSNTPCLLHQYLLHSPLLRKGTVQRGAGVACGRGRA